MKHILLVLTLTLFPASAFADKLAERCPDLIPCANAVSALTGEKYVYDIDVKGPGGATPNIELTKDNATLLFTEMLNIAGYARVPTGEPNTWRLMRQRDARDSALPFATASKTVPPELPNTWDLYTIKYKGTNPEVMEDIARALRSFMPANSRIIPDGLTGGLFVTDTAANLKKAYQLIRDLDVKPTAFHLKQKAAETARNLEERRREKSKREKMDR